MSDALYLHKGGIAPAPASGDMAIVLDTDGTVKTVDSDGVKTALGGGQGPIADQTVLGNISGGAASPVGLTKSQLLTLLGVSPVNEVKQAIMIRAQALLGTTANVIQGTEFFLNPALAGDWASNVASGGTATLSNALASGVVLVKSNGTSGGSATVSIAGTSSPAAQVSNLKTTRWYAYWRAKMATAVDAQTTLDFELSDTGAQAQVSIGVAAAYRPQTGAFACSTGAGIQSTMPPWRRWSIPTGTTLKCGTTLSTSL